MVDNASVGINALSAPRQPVLTSGLAREIVAAAERQASGEGFAMCIAVVDGGGYLTSFARMDGAQLGSVDVAIGKARTAVMFKRPTKALQEALEGGMMAVLCLDGAVAVQGGLPLVVDGTVIGGIGVSGGTPPGDELVASAASALAKPVK